MNTIIYDPSYEDSLSVTRGGGRFVEILKENLTSARFTDRLEEVGNNDILIIPFFKPFEKPILTKRIAKKQILVIYDVIPLAYPAHFPVGLRGTFNLWRNKQALKYYDTIVTISHHSKNDIIHYLNIPPEKIEVIYPTISKSFDKPITTNYNQLQPTLTNYCLYVGDVNWNKNLVNLARAIKIANIPCVFAGKNFEARKSLLPESLHLWQKEFRDFLKEIADDPLFLFVGYVSDDELINLYKQSMVNILISRDEGFGFSYLEASTLGCSSILSDTDIFHEIADAAATFANPDDPEDIASKITSISHNTALRQKLSLEAQERSKIFSPESFQNQWKKVIQS